MRHDDAVTRSTMLGFLTILPLLVWWAGWYPGIMTSDSIDQWNQATSFTFFNAHPITHTASLWVVSLVWESPGAVALVQVVLTAVLLAVIARRLTQIGIIWWIGVGTVWVISVIPMTGAMTIAIWKDVPFSLAMVWVFTELLWMARDTARFWSRPWPPIRLGVALGLMWALRANGKLTAIAFLIALGIAMRSHRRGVLTTVGATLAVGVGVPMVLLSALPVTDNPIEPAQVFMPDVAAVVVHARDALSDSDLELATAVAPLSVYEEYYACGDSTPLLFNAGYHNEVIRDDPWAYRGLVLRAVLDAPATVAGHRWCAGEYLLSPFNRTRTFVHRPPFDIWPNTLGLARDPISDRAYAATKWAYQAIERSSVEWMTWRPAIFVLLGLVTYGFVTWRRRLRPLTWIGALYALQLVNVFVTSPAHEFRYAYGLYLIALASLPLWYLIADPARAALAPPPPSSGVARPAPATDEAAGNPNR
jgi:Family of unknown function (DUF6020)